MLHTGAHIPAGTVTNWVNYLADLLVENYGIDKYEVNNYAMSSRALCHDGGWNNASIWKGEKFDDFVNSKADAYIIMLGQNDNVYKLNGTWVSHWN